MTYVLVRLCVCISAFSDRCFGLLVWIFTLAFVVAAAASTSLIYTVANNKQMFKFFIHVSENFRWHAWKATHEMFTFFSLHTLCCTDFSLVFLAISCSRSIRSGIFYTLSEIGKHLCKNTLVYVCLVCITKQFV